MPTRLAPELPATAVPLDGMSALFDRAVVGMALVAQDGHFVRVNDALGDALGWAPQELVGRRWTDLADREDLTALSRRFGELLAGEHEDSALMVRGIRPDGVETVLEVSSQLVVVDGERLALTQILDVTEQSEAVAAICAAERRFRALATCSTDAVYWLQLEPEVRFRFVNEAAAAMTGYTADELHHDPGLRRRIVHPEDVRLLEALRTGGAEGTADGALVRWIRRDGTVLWVEQRLSVIAQEGGVVTDALGVARDVTARVEAARRRARHDAQQRAVAALAEACLTNFGLGSVHERAAAEVAAVTDSDAVALWWEIEPGGHFSLAAGSGFVTMEPGRAVVSAADSHAARVRALDATTTFEQASGLTATEVGGELVAEGIRSGVGVPIRCGSGTVGVLAVYSHDVVAVDPEDILFLQALANTVGACAERVRYDDHVGYLALHDSLTGLPNRAMLIDHLDRSLGAAGPGVVVVAVCDIDDFKLLNDGLGHAAADELLAAVAARLASLDADAMVARTGGDEFAIVLPAAADAFRAATLVSDVMNAIAEPVALSSGPISVSVSVGVSVGTSGDAATDLLTSAFGAVHRAKSSGRGRWLYASGEEQATAVRRLELMSGLGAAVRDGAIRADMQPIVRLRDGSVVGYEALARWTLPDGTPVSPTEFIPIAEETGIIRDLGREMLDQACAFLAEARRRPGGESLFVTVNLSCRQLDDPDLSRQVSAVLARYQLSRSSICLELTESLLAPDDVPLRARLDNLKALGVRLAIDDFGTGYSSFAYLTQFPIDVLKLDRAFVTEIHADPRRIAVARSIVVLAEALGITMLAEGIETTEERATFEELGCQLGQGFLWSAAVAPETALARLGEPS